MPMQLYVSECTVCISVCVYVCVDSWSRCQQPWPRVVRGRRGLVEPAAFTKFLF